MTTKITTTPTPLAVVDKINVLVDESNTNATNITSAKNASITGLSVSGKVITYTKGNGTTGTITTQDTNTTYSAMTASEATAGTATTARSITAKVLHDKIKETMTSSAGLPIGHMYWSIEPNVPAGRLPALGVTYNRSLYADLWAWANSVGLVKTESEWQAIASANGGNCAYYSSGDGSTTFRVPSIKGWVKGANSIDEVGSYLEAGLPNITGYMELIGAGSSGFYADAYEGALSSVKKRNTTNQFYNLGNAGSSIKDGIEFDASSSNPIYGNSDTVQPPSLVGQWLIVAFGVANNIGETDVANVMQVVEQVQTGLGKVDGITDYIVESYRNGTKWYRIWKSGWIEQGGAVGTANNSYKDYTITFPKAFADTTYYVNVIQNDSESNDIAPRVHSKTKTSVVLGSVYNKNALANWYACGQGA